MNYKNLAWALALYVGVVAAIYKAPVQKTGAHGHRGIGGGSQSDPYNE